MPRGGMGSGTVGVRKQVNPQIIRDIKNATPEAQKLVANIGQIGHAVYNLAEAYREHDYKVDSLKMSEDFQRNLDTENNRVQQRYLNGELSTPDAYMNAQEEAIRRARDAAYNNAFGSEEDGKGGYMRNAHVNRLRAEQTLETLQGRALHVSMQNYMTMQKQDRDTRLSEQYAYAREVGGETGRLINKMTDDANYAIPADRKALVTATRNIQLYADEAATSCDKTISSVFNDESKNLLQGMFLSGYDGEVEHWVSSAESTLSYQDSQVESFVKRAAEKETSTLSNTEKVGFAQRLNELVRPGREKVRSAKNSIRDFVETQRAAANKTAAQQVSDYYNGKISDANDLSPMAKGILEAGQYDKAATVRSSSKSGPSKAKTTDVAGVVSMAAGICSNKDLTDEDRMAALKEQVVPAAVAALGSETSSLVDNLVDGYNDSVSQFYALPLKKTREDEVRTLLGYRQHYHKQAEEIFEAREKGWDQLAGLVSDMVPEAQRASVAEVFDEGKEQLSANKALALSHFDEWFTLAAASKKQSGTAASRSGKNAISNAADLALKNASFAMALDYDMSAVGLAATHPLEDPTGAATIYILDDKWVDPTIYGGGGAYAGCLTLEDYSARSLMFLRADVARVQYKPGDSLTEVEMLLNAAKGSLTRSDFEEFKGDLTAQMFSPANKDSAALKDTYGHLFDSEVVKVCGDKWKKTKYGAPLLAVKCQFLSRIASCKTPEMAQRLFKDEAEVIRRTYAKELEEEQLRDRFESLAAQMTKPRSVSTMRVVDELPPEEKYRMRLEKTRRDAAAAAKEAEAAGKEAEVARKEAVDAGMLARARATEKSWAAERETKRAMAAEVETYASKSRRGLSLNAEPTAEEKQEELVAAAKKDTRDIGREFSAAIPKPEQRRKALKEQTSAEDSARAHEAADKRARDNEAAEAAAAKKREEEEGAREDAWADTFKWAVRDNPSVVNRIVEKKGKSAARRRLLEEWSAFTPAQRNEIARKLGTTTEAIEKEFGWKKKG